MAIKSKKSHQRGFAGHSVSEPLARDWSCQSALWKQIIAVLRKKKISFVRLICACCRSRVVAAPFIHTQKYRSVPGSAQCCYWRAYAAFCNGTSEADVARIAKRHLKRDQRAWGQSDISYGERTSGALLNNQKDCKEQSIINKENNSCSKGCWHKVKFKSWVFPFTNSLSEM